MLFWQVAAGLNALDKVNVFKWEYSLPDFMCLVEMLEIKTATEMANQLDADLKKPKGGR